MAQLKLLRLSEKKLLKRKLLKLLRLNVRSALLTPFAVLIERESTFIGSLLLQQLVIFVELSQVVEITTGLAL